MSTASKIVWLCLGSAAVVAGTMHLFLPGGLSPLVSKLIASEAGSTQPPTRAPESPAHAAPTDPTDGEETLRSAEKAYDHGEFGDAIDLFQHARAATSGTLRDRATRGLGKAVLAWALTHDTPPLKAPSDAEDQLASRAQAAESDPQESTWLVAADYAAATGLHGKLKYLSQQALGCARAGGPVEKRLRTVLERAGSRTGALSDAMAAQGFLEPVDPMAGKDPAKPTAKAAGAAPIDTPVGTFSEATRSKLSRAVALERKGTKDYELAGPDDPNRKEHRKSALASLKEARDIYQEAADEDPKSKYISERLRSVLEMISHIKKESSIGD